MPSCSRIARRCGERDASRGGGAGGASAIALARSPHFFGRPLPRPLGGDVVVVLVRLRVVRRVQLDQALDREVVRAQQVEQLAVREMELDLAGVLPLDTAEIALR